MIRAAGIIAGLGLALAGSCAAAAETLPLGITIQQTDRGAVYADANGRTFYGLGRGEGSGGGGGQPCSDKQFTEGTDGFRGAKHPLIRLDARPTCAKKNPAAIVPAGVAASGPWSVIERPDGTRQWAYDRRPVHTSVKDGVPGSVNGAAGQPLFVPFDHPAGVSIKRPPSGGAYLVGPNSQLLLTRQAPCHYDCAPNQPFVAPELADPLGAWTIGVMPDGRPQWSYVGRPLYLPGGEAAPPEAKAKDWSIVALARPAPLPSDFTTVVTTPGRTGGGRLVAIKGGATIYIFGCQEDGPDRLDCDDPDDRSVLWTTLCGSVERCAALFRPVTPSGPAKGDGKVWSVVTVDAPWAPVRSARQGQGIKVWAYRGRPVFTYAGDRQPGDTDGEIGYQGRAWTAIEAAE